MMKKGEGIKAKIKREESANLNGCAYTNAYVW